MMLASQVLEVGGKHFSTRGLFALWNAPEGESLRRSRPNEWMRMRYGHPGGVHIKAKVISVGCDAADATPGVGEWVGDKLLPTASFMEALAAAEGEWLQVLP